MTDEYKAIVDIGTNKIATVVGEYNQISHELNILGFGRAKSEGVKNGTVVDLEKTANAIVRAIEDAETMSGREIKNVGIGISGGHIRIFESTGVTAVARPEKEITPADINRAIELAKAIKINGNSEMLHILPKEFIIDGQGGVKDPTNMMGMRLEVKAHIITVANNALHNLVKSVNNSGLHIDNYAINSLASSAGALTAEEKDLGVIMIDIGAGTADLSAFENGALLHTSAFDMGGEQITIDISKHFRTSFNESERLKIKFGTALVENCDESEEIDAQLVGAMKLQKIKRIELAQVIEKNLTAMFQEIKKRIDKEDLIDKAVCGIVLTGGVSETAGILELCEKILELPARIGSPINIIGVSDYVKKPEYSTAVGLLALAFENEDLNIPAPSQNPFDFVFRKSREMIGSFFNF